MTLTELDDQTGYGNGDEYDSAVEVRDYFTVKAQREIFGFDAIDDQDLLDEMAEKVFLFRYHFSPNFKE